MPRSPWIDEDLAIFQDQTARFLQKEFAAKREGWDKAGIVDKDSWRKAGEAGLICASIPAVYGGGGGTLAHEAVLIEEIARAGLAGNFGSGLMVHAALVAHYILAYASEEQRLDWLPRMARGELIGAIAMTEPGTGSDLQGVRTTARAVDGGYVINGQKTFISNGQNCGLIVVVCKSDATAGSKGLSLLVVETDLCEGFRRGRNLDKLGMHGQDTSELFFDDVFVPAANLLGGREGQGFVQLANQLAWERLSCAIGAVVNTEIAVDLTLDYVRQRKAFGQLLFDFQNTQFKLAECKTQAVVARSFIDDLIVRLLAGELDPATAAMAKLWTSETQCRVIDECQQLHGGYGYMEEYPIARMWADARVSRIFAGTNEIMKLIIARSL